MTFTLVVCAIIIVGYYIIFLSPVVAKATKLFRETAKLQVMINKAEMSINSIPRIKKEIEELKSKESFYSNKLPKEEEFPAVLENLSSMAQSAGVKITKIQPKKDVFVSSESDEDSDIYRQQAILITALCGYHQLGSFIAAMENAERFMEVADIRIDSRRANPRRHSVQLTIKTFILKEVSEE